MAAQLQRNPTWLPVVAAALFDSAGNLLLQKRPADKRHGGLWEFPGGKVEPGESPAIALLREIEEELALSLDRAALEPCCFEEHPAEEGHPPIVILLYTVRSWNGEPRSTDGAELVWIAPHEAVRLAMPPLDIGLLDKLLRMAK